MLSREPGKSFISGLTWINSSFSQFKIVRKKQREPLGRTIKLKPAKSVNLSSGRLR